MTTITNAAASNARLATGGKALAAEGGDQT
jgi:hypothetical protein